MSNINIIKDYTNKITESPGAIYGEFTKQMLKDHEQSDFNQYLKKNLKKLKDKNIIASEEENQINEIIDIITSTKEFNKKADEVITLYKQIMDDKHSGKMARVISCIAADSAHNKYQRPRNPTGRENNKIEYVFGINISGALVGAVIGSNADGTEGAILGALIGATASSVTT
jgi:predicted ribosome quality control (RQC) complex YloA/Tae2 family protein